MKTQIIPAAFTAAICLLLAPVSAYAEIPELYADSSSYTDGTQSKLSPRLYCTWLEFGGPSDHYKSAIVTYCKDNTDIYAEKAYFLNSVDLRQFHARGNSVHWRSEITTAVAPQRAIFGLGRVIMKSATYYA